MSRKALIVVDMLNDFISEKGALYCGETARRIVPFIRQRVKTYESSGDLVVYLRDAHDENDLEFEKFPRHCIAGSWGSEIIPDLSPGPGAVVIAKKRYSGFYGTELADILASGLIREVEVVGVCTSICVMDTVGELANRDYPIRVPVDGVADFDPDFHRFALKRMKQLYGADVS
jgi:nicotinamidase-related amidase